MRWIAAMALTGWGGIVALAWWLADRRIAACYPMDSGCIERAHISRDAVLIWGPSVALAMLTGFALLELRRTKRLNLTDPAQPATIRAGLKRLR